MWLDRVFAFGAKLTAKAPAIVLTNLAVAIAAYWSGLIPAVALDLLACVSISLAFCVIIVGKKSIPYRTKEDLGYSPNFTEALTTNMLFRGYPDEGYGLGIACLAGLFLSGGQAAEERVVAAAFFLSVAWSFVNRVWPAPGDKS